MKQRRQAERRQRQAQQQHVLGADGGTRAAAELAYRRPDEQIPPGVEEADHHRAAGRGVVRTDIGSESENSEL